MITFYLKMTLIFSIQTFEFFQVKVVYLESEKTLESEHIKVECILYKLRNLAGCFIRYYQ